MFSRNIKVPTHRKMHKHSSEKKKKKKRKQKRSDGEGGDKKSKPKSNVSQEHLLHFLLTNLLLSSARDTTIEYGKWILTKIIFLFVKVRYGGLSDSSKESHDWSPAHRTRQRRVNYMEMPNTESEDVSSLTFSPPHCRY